MTLAEDLNRMGRDARAAARHLRLMSANDRTAALQSMARSLEQSAPAVMEANAKDVANGEDAGLSPAMVDRLRVDEKRLAGIVQAVSDVAALPDPLGTELARWTRPNGLDIARVRVPIGTIGIIYESRPNVTADAAALCLRSGNAVILRGGSEAFHSNEAIHKALVAGLEEAGTPAAAVQRIPTTDRAAVSAMLQGLNGTVDLVVPRGGASLVARVREEARVPVLSHLEGICHLYLHKDADPAKAVEITVNAKMRRTGICGAAEALLVDQACAERLLPPVAQALRDAGCTLRGDPAARAIAPPMEEAQADDWGREYLDAILAVRVVSGLSEALDHIARYGSGHTESIVTEDAAAAETFLTEADSAIVMHNASTQFADGGEFGLGAEIGIATGRLHARGPVGAEQLTTFKYVVRGQGQARP